MFFKKKEKGLKAFTTGSIVPITSVPDEVFSGKMMGDGIAIQPTSNTIYAPCNGKIAVVMNGTEHAVGITLENGMEILIHVGLDTVNLTEKLLHAHVKVGDTVTCGDTLITYDKEALKNKGINDITMLVILNQGNCKIGVMKETGEVIEKQDIIINYN